MTMVKVEVDYADGHYEMTMREDGRTEISIEEWNAYRKFQLEQSKWYQRMTELDNATYEE